MFTAMYAPMKAPSHPVPSGERQMARLFMQALAGAGAGPTVICGLRTYDRGDERRQRRLDALAARAAPLLARRLAQRPPHAWFTYHCYHKAPDGLGPRTAGLLDLPYVIAEASIAPARANGPWSEGYRQSVGAIAAADVVIALTEKDAHGLASVVRPPARLVRLAPFTDVEPRPPVAEIAAEPRLVVVAMMREGAKERSYLLLAEALAGLLDRPWRLDVIGDGPRRSAVEAALCRALGERVCFHGRIDDASTRNALVAGARAFVWPAVDEAYGLALLEAQALGVPVVAGDGHGVPDIIADGRTGRLAPVGDVLAFRAHVATLLAAPARAMALGAAASASVRRRHSVAAAATALRDILRLARAAHAARRQ